MNIKGIYYTNHDYYVAKLRDVWRLSLYITLMLFGILINCIGLVSYFIDRLLLHDYKQIALRSICVGQKFMIFIVIVSSFIRFNG